MSHSFGSENTSRKNIHNADAVAIKAGGPVFWDSSATASDALGFHAVASDSLPAAQEGLFVGLAVREISAGERGSVQCAGFFQEARIIKMTRAATTDIFASYPAGAVGDILDFLTVTGVQALTRSGAGSATNDGWFAMLMETFVSSTTQASGVNTLLTFGDTLKVFLRSV
jgi:predicted RecA/RadA family phage recombinase